MINSVKRNTNKEVIDHEIIRLLKDQEMVRSKSGRCYNLLALKTLALTLYRFNFIPKKIAGGGVILCMVQGR